jgi:hypothetical protein
MNTNKMLWTLAIVLLAAVAGAQNSSKPSTKQETGGAASAPKQVTTTTILERALNNVQHEFVDAADAMPEDKYTFAPTSGEFKGVRTFADQVKHVAATNYIVAGGILGEKPPVDVGDESGPANLTSKADIMKYLRDSFEYSHRAFQTINDQNAAGMVKSPFGNNQSPRLGLAMLITYHAMDHYGQMVEYLRMNNIIPPASRPQQKR